MSPQRECVVECSNLARRDSEDHEARPQGEPTVARRMNREYVLFLFWNHGEAYVMGVLRILVIVLGLCGAAWAQNLSPRAFTETFATEFRRAIPSATITRGDLQITV